MIATEGSYTLIFIAIHQIVQLLCLCRHSLYQSGIIPQERQNLIMDFPVGLELPLIDRKLRHIESGSVPMEHCTVNNRLGTIAEIKAVDISVHSQQISAGFPNPGQIGDSEIRPKDASHGLKINCREFRSDPIIARCFRVCSHRCKQRQRVLYGCYTLCKERSAILRIVLIDRCGSNGKTRHTPGIPVRGNVMTPVVHACLDCIVIQSIPYCFAFCIGHKVI